MNQDYSSRLRQALAVGLMGLFFTGTFHFAQRPTSGPALVSQLFEDEEEGDNDGDREYPDRPDKALEQDIALTRDPATGTVPRERLLAAARYNDAVVAARGQQRSTAGTLTGANWAERGPSNVAGRIRSLLVDPTDPTGNTLWAGAAGGGLWKTTNATTAGVQWQSVNASLTNLAVTTIVAAPGTSPQVLYCGTGEGFFNSDAIRGAGIWKSSDNGVSWTHLSSTNNQDFYFVQKLIVHPVTGDVYAATRTGLWRSQNAGTSWNLVLGQFTSPATLTPRAADLEIGADNTLYASFGIFSTDGIYRSPTGNPGTWTKLNNVATSGLPTTGYQRIELACAPSAPNRLYALFQSSASGRPLLDMYRSLDYGDTWTVMARPGATAADPTFDFTNGQSWYDLIIGVSPTDPNVVYVGGLDLWLTNNGAIADPTQVTWTHSSFWNASPNLSFFVHADHHAIAFVPPVPGTAATKAYFGNDGGVFYSSNAGAPTTAFSNRNNGLNVTQFYSVAMHPTNYNYFLAGSQDNGTQKFTAAGLGTTTPVSGGDGGFCAIDQTNPQVQFSSYVYNQYFRSINGGTSFTYYKIDEKLGSFINPFDYDSRQRVLYAAYSAGNYLVWTNAGIPVSAAPTTITQSLGVAGTVTRISVSPGTNKRIYVGTNTGLVLRVDDASTTTPVVTTLLTGTSNTSVSCIAVDPSDEQHLLVTYANYGVVSVFESRNAEATSPTWTAVEGSLPDMPVRWALFDPSNTARALLATEMGVYSTELLNGTRTVWAPASNGPINTRVDMLRYRAGDQLVVAATHGRGLFTTDVLASVPLAAKPAALALLTKTYPNPFTTELHLELAPSQAADVTVTLTDALGRRLLTSTMRPIARQVTVPVPASIAPGTYTLTVYSNGRQSSRQVVKQ
ncbi:T9SS type A sorting domain-containing protein [Hymenobacter terrenus]|uniref:T9SS type A sorting domain-containing protein n=1 Tax=Hymenobacter terrenus TaxID=1629124 RepID=UPI000619F093|nr:T9SS type A sorting domain-containing protein [Hymenobacter terrenus]